MLVFLLFKLAKVRNIGESLPPELIICRGGYYLYVRNLDSGESYLLFNFYF